MRASVTTSASQPTHDRDPLAACSLDLEPTITSTTRSAGALSPADSTADAGQTHPLDPIFHPRAVAIVGVSSESGPRGMRGGMFLHALLEQGYQDEHGLYAVNPKMNEVRGVPCFPTLLDCPDPVDHVISQIPAAGVPALVEQCIEKGVRSIHLFTAGLAETGDADLVAMEREMVAKARAAGLRMIGPNCMGLYVPGVGLAFNPGSPNEPGDVFLLSQSGANAGAIVGGLDQRGLRFSKGVSYGNGADVRAHELLDYAAGDPQSSVVVAYIEGVQDGRAFLEALRRCAALKPTILLKGGITGAGARAANSHTGSLAGSIDVFEALCRQTGALRARTMDELLDLAVAVTTDIRHVRRSGVTLVGMGGGFAVLSADQMALEGLTVPPLPERTQEELREFIPIAGTSVRNPVDATFGRDHPLDLINDRERTRRAFRVIADAESTDMVFTTVGGWHGFHGDDSSQAREQRALEEVDEIARFQRESGVPFAMIRDGRGGSTVLESAQRQGLAVFPTVERASRVVGRLLEWRTLRQGLPELF